jgi:hypothetical protein
VHFYNGGHQYLFGLFYLLKDFNLREPEDAIPCIIGKDNILPTVSLELFNMPVLLTSESGRFNEFFFLTCALKSLLLL